MTNRELPNASAELRKFLAPEFVFGAGSLELAGQYATNLGARRLLVVSDPGVQAARWTEKAVESLHAAGLRCSVFSHVTPNPRLSEAMEGADYYREHSCDALLAVGGGSPIDCAKGIGVAVATGRYVGEFEGVDRIGASMPPMLCIPTTAGTSADVSQFAILSDPEQKRKLAIISKAVVPDVSLVDPVCLTTMDPFLTACSGIDALVHAIEAFVSTGHSPVTDLHALEAIRLIHGHLLGSLCAPDCLEERSGMALASLQAGLAFSNASLGAVHAMAHALGGILDLPHGLCNALLLEHVVEFNYPETPERFRCIAAALGQPVDGLSDAQARRLLCETLSRLRQKAGIQGTLASLGVHRTDIPELARNAMRDACIVTTPRIPVQRDLETIYEQAL